MFVTSDANLYEKVLTLSNHGRDKNETRMFWPAVVGFKYKMSNVQAAMGCAQLLRINELVLKRQETLSTYKKELLSFGNILMNPDQENCENGAWMPTIVFGKLDKFYQEVFEDLRIEGIDVRPFFVPLSQLGLFQKSNFNPTSARLANLGFNLPSYYDITVNDLRFVVSSLQRLTSQAIC